MSNVPRIRSIRETAKFFKKMDPETQLTENTIRIMVSNGVIPAFKTGKKYLINVEKKKKMCYGENTEAK